MGKKNKKNAAKKHKTTSKGVQGKTMDNNNNNDVPVGGPETPPRRNESSADAMFLTSSPKHSPPTKSTVNGTNTNGTNGTNVTNGTIVANGTASLLSPSSLPAKSTTENFANMNSFLTRSPKASPPCSSSDLQALGTPSPPSLQQQKPKPTTNSFTSNIDRLFAKIDEENERRSRSNSLATPPPGSPAISVPSSPKVSQKNSTESQVPNIKKTNHEIITDASKELKKMSSMFFQESKKLKKLSDNVATEGARKAAKLSMTKLIDKAINGAKITAAMIKSALDENTTFTDGVDVAEGFDVLGQVLENGAVHISSLPVRAIQFHSCNFATLESGVALICSEVENILNDAKAGSAKINGRIAPPTLKEKQSEGIISPFADLIASSFTSDLLTRAEEIFDLRNLVKDDSVTAAKANNTDDKKGPREDKKSEACLVS